MKETTKPTTTNKNKYTKNPATDSVELVTSEPEEPNRFINSGVGQIAVRLFSPHRPNCNDLCVTQSSKKAKNRTKV
ncbi:unnamed protein product [marine sediment metagenome]|uniref:Uncharacterized protein n=1 Tax=marine sediment metagenome TaxID=412755 RepID=X0S491_9ZZZZ